MQVKAFQRLRYLVCAVFILALRLVSWQGMAAIPAAERAALIALYNSTSGAGWTDKTGWKTPPLYTDGFAMPGTESGWHGVTVSADHVATILLSVNKLSGSIPTQLSNLTKLINPSLDLRWNALYTTDSALRTFLNTRQNGGNWESTQTILPTNLAAGSLSTNSVNVTWTPIAYTADTGGYRVYYSQYVGGPYTLFNTTANKSASSLPVTGLTSGMTYFFKVQTVTNPHTKNQNTVISQLSTPISDTTGLTTPGKAYLPTIVR